MQIFQNSRWRGQYGFSLALILFSAISLIPGGCVGTTNLILLDQTVSVAGEGGGAAVFFSGSAGQTVRITLTGSPTSREPYGHLEPPGGNATSVPSNGASVNGVNTADVTLQQTGQYTFTVFDGSGQGGNVRVLVWVLPPL